MAAPFRRMGTVGIGDGERSTWCGDEWCPPPHVWSGGRIPDPVPLETPRREQKNRMGPILAKTTKGPQEDLFAVWRPFHYRKWFTMKRCINLIIFRTRNFVTISVYAFTLFVFVITERPLTLARVIDVIVAIMAEGCAALLINQDQCFFQRNYAEMMRILAIVRCTLLLRILVDPILSFATDFQIRRIFFIMIGVKQELAYGTSRVFQKSSEGSSEEIRLDSTLFGICNAQSAPKIVLCSEQQQVITIMDGFARGRSKDELGVATRGDPAHDWGNHILDDSLSAPTEPSILSWSFVGT
ncbi:hypothetical protein TELCIR_07429 [Teladorsagia circumcincta]|uniref:Uncharacterized protein n=1 Tax=Teladorsagia circumcincta TaxID=45464 RepID=A0A2G9UKB2_TELCI|nr:hypothetical protein TELCIR_07429 [Teladorsagia circumcincta]